MIRKIPIFFKALVSGCMDGENDITSVPIWIKMHDVLIIEYTDDGLSAIASKIGKPLMLDSYTSNMCINAWGRPSFDRAMVEVSAENPLKEKVVNSYS